MCQDSFGLLGFAFIADAGSVAQCGADLLDACAVGLANLSDTASTNCSRIAMESVDGAHADLLMSVTRRIKSF
jgi:hypothetical protein